jgi:hypothetical protein
VGIAIGGRRPKQTQTGTRLLDGMLQQPHLVPVTPDSKGFSVLLVLTELTHLSRISQVMLGFRAVTAWVSSSSPRGGCGTLAQEGLLWSPPGGAIPICVLSRLPFAWIFAPPIFVSKLKMCFLDDMGHTLGALIILQ